VASVVVAGAGQHGMRCATLLARAGAEVTIVERLSAPGGRDPERSAGEIAGSAARSGVRLLVDTLALQFGGTFVEVLSTDGLSRLPCDALVVATGSRPASRAELAITGDRCAGVVPGPAALRLTWAGVLLGHRPLIAGSGELALQLAMAQLGAGASTVGLTMPAGARQAPDVGIRVYDGYRVLSVHGAIRVEKAILSNELESILVQTDALILAAGLRPLRNIEGAIEQREGVFFCQPNLEDEGVRGAEMDASETATQVRAAFG
jgi:pyruvate/2-oxoglutarate dehydrogenase complex dihydrolipoamide dehydrogenase (E3) component